MDIHETLKKQPLYIEESKKFQDCEVVEVVDDDGKVIGIAVYHWIGFHYWCGYIATDDQVFTIDEIWNQYRDDLKPLHQIPNTSMEPTGGNFHNELHFGGFDHAHGGDMKVYTPLYMVINEIRWYYKKMFNL